MSNELPGAPVTNKNRKLSTRREAPCFDAAPTSVPSTMRRDVSNFTFERPIQDRCRHFPALHDNSVYQRVNQYTTCFQKHYRHCLLHQRGTNAQAGPFTRNTPIFSRVMTHDRHPLPPHLHMFIPPSQICPCPALNPQNLAPPSPHPAAAAVSLRGLAEPSNLGILALGA